MTREHGAHLDPAPSQWSSLALRWFRDSGSAGARDRRAETRRALDLPTDRPVVMSGHQPLVWHPGILAKQIAASAAASSIEGVCAWVVADQDDAPFHAIRAPVHDGVMPLEVVEIALTAATPGRAAGAAPPFEPLAPGPLNTIEQVQTGVREIRDALRDAQEEAPSAAMQVARAVWALAEQRGVRAPHVTLFATRLHRAPVFHRLLETMRRDPLACARAYNRAVEAHADAGLTPLLVSSDETRIELPLWRIDAGGVRTRVFADQLPTTDPASLAPRALLMTAALRLEACDLFIHGVGGGVYDKAAEDWVRAWLGEALAPMVVATATLTLPLLDEPLPTDEDVRRAEWLAHHAQHDPDALGDDRAAAEKSRFLQEIAARREHGGDPRQPFLQMHEALAKYRTQQRSALDALRKDAKRLRRMRACADIANDRTWPFPFYDRDTIQALAADIESAIRSPARTA